MYCSNCGQNIPNDSTFCSECGNKCIENNSVTLNINNMDIQSNKYVKYILESIKHPITTIKNGGNNISIKENLLYIFLISLIIPFIQILSIRSFIVSIGENVFNFFNTLNGKTSNLKDLIDLKSQLSKSLDSYIKFSDLYKDVYFLSLFHYVLLYGIILFMIYFCYKHLIKSEFSLNDFIRVIAVTSIVNLMFVILASIVLLISALFSILVSIISGTIIILILAIGLNHLLNGNNKFVYIFSTFYGLSILVTNYLCIKYVISIIQTLTFRYF